MRLAVISDLHIESNTSPIYRDLLDFLSQDFVSETTIVFLGDIFDVFVGSKNIYITEFQEFFDALKRLDKSNLQIIYIEGNHDFQMEKVFSEIPSIKYLTSDYQLTLAGKQFYFSHGDLANPLDYSYRVLRWILRTKTLRFLIENVPDQIVAWVASALKLSSKGGQQYDVEGMRSTYRKFAEKKIIAHEADFLIMGHCHDPDEYTFLIGGRPRQYINVGFPPSTGLVLNWAAGDTRVTRQKLNASH